MALTSKDIERTDSKEKTDIIQPVHGIEASDYQDFLVLNEHFQGKVLDKLNHKVDRHVIPVLLLIYLLSYIDRANVGNARLFGAQTDLKLSNTDWNVGLCLLFITFAIASTPFNALVKIYSARVILPFSLLGCGVVIIGAGCSNNKAQWFALRLLLGLVESGIFGGCAYSLTTWYSPQVLHSRLNFFYLGATMSGGLSGLLAYGIGQLDHKWGYRGWRWIYVLEGLFSVCFSVIAFFWIQGDPESKHRWLTAEEQRFIILRSKFMYGSDSTGNSVAFSWKDFLSAAKSPTVLILGVAEFSFCVGIYGFAFTLPTIIKNMGFTAAKAQALSAPPYFIACLALLACGALSDRYKKRALTIIIPSIMAFIGLIICMSTANHKNLVPLTYIGCVIAAMGFYCLTPSFTLWISVNVAGQTKRAAALGLGAIFTQCAGVVGSNIYLTKEAPTYHVGFGVSLALLFFGDIILPGVYWLWIGRVNKRRDAISEEEIRAKYTLEELEVMGDTSPLYRYER